MTKAVKEQRNDNSNPILNSSIDEIVCCVYVCVTNNKKHRAKEKQNKNHKNTENTIKSEVVHTQRERARLCAREMKRLYFDLYTVVAVMSYWFHFISI